MVDLTSSPTVEPEALPGRAYPRLEDQVGPQAFGSEVGQGIEKAADVLQNVHNRMQTQARQTMVTDAHNQTQALSLSLTHDPNNGAFTKQGKNAFGLDQQYLPQFDQGVQNIANGIADPRAKQVYLQSIAPTARQHLAEQLDTHELTQHKDYSQQTTQASIEMAGATAAANYNHPDIVASNKDTVDYNVARLAQDKGWSDEQTAYALNKAHTQFHSQIIDSMVAQGNLSQARTYLYTQAANGEIDPKAGDALQRMLLAKEEHDLAMNDKIQRDSSNAILKNGILLQQNGQLTPQFIEKYHNTLEPQAYEYLYNTLKGKETSTDPHTFAPLLSDALSGKDVSQQAQDALFQGKLSLADYKGIIEKSEQPRKGYVSRGNDYISQSLKPDAMVRVPAEQIALANALDDWRQWTKDNPEATEEQARGTYRNIADHYQVVSANQATLFNAVPLHLVGSRTQPDIPATWAATKAAHDAGTLSDTEFKRQATLILQWQAANKPKAAPAPKAP